MPGNPDLGALASRVIDANQYMVPGTPNPHGAPRLSPVYYTPSGTATSTGYIGHESIKTTYIYQHANNQLKQDAIDRTATIGTPPGRYQPPDSLIAFLEGL